jgi:hypothetical protein
MFSRMASADVTAPSGDEASPRGAGLQPDQGRGRSAARCGDPSLADAGWAEPLFYETTVDELGDGLAREAIAAGADAVLVAGGDGTVRAVSEAMAGVEVPLTIVPSGTGNLLARNLQLPLPIPTP